MTINRNRDGLCQEIKKKMVMHNFYTIGEAHQMVQKFEQLQGIWHFSFQAE